MSDFRCSRSLFLRVPLLAFPLLVAMVLIVISTASAAAQSSQDKNPGAQTLATDPNPPDHMGIDQFRFQPGQLALPHSYFWSPRPEGDSVCYTMRSYLVVRDSPHSDTTHRAGYSTCQSAKKFEVRSTQQEVQPSR